LLHRQERNRKQSSIRLVWSNRDLRLLRLLIHTRPSVPDPWTNHLDREVEAGPVSRTCPEKLDRF
jgi:hypothetical protein